jgi:DNA-binding NtrC family response regulator
MDRHILIVDDDGDVLEIFMLTVEELGYRVSIARGGAEMRRFLAGSDPVDAVILDCQMPGETSIDLALHAKSLNLPVVMTSGSLDAIEHADLLKLQLLQKPFTMLQLAKAIDLAFSSHAFGQRDA